MRYKRILNAITKQQYEIQYFEKPFFKCNTCKTDRIYQSGAWISKVIKNETENIGTKFKRFTQITEKYQLLTKTDSAPCPKCETGKIEFIGYKIKVENITEREVTNMGGFGIESGSRTVETVYCNSRDEQLRRFWRLVDFYENRKIKEVSA